MASRRDELNAYTFAKKRTVAAFLQPSPTGSDEGAPAPLRAVLPGMVTGALILAGFGAWGMFKPTAPQGWDKPAANVIVGSDSTTRYVVLKTGRKIQLHPVLNLASARLLLDPDSFAIIKVDEKVLDSGKIPHGPTIGIPYAPDRLPAPADAGKAKRWAVCEQPGGHGNTVQKAAFILADREATKVEGRQRLHGGQTLYVQGRDGARYLVDAKGTKYLIGGPNWQQHSNELLLRILVGGRQPQHVTDDWLGTLHTGSPIVFPTVPGTVGAPAGIPGLAPEVNKVGTVLRAPTGSGPQQYVVLPGKVTPVSDFVARLLLNSTQTTALGQDGKPKDMGAGSFTPAPPSQSFYGQYAWPRPVARPVNSPSGYAARDTACTVLRHVGSKDQTTLSTWAGTSYPAPIVNGGTTTYVTPGTGLLFKQIQGAQSQSGGLFLVTDTGLRYALQENGDSSARTSKIGANGSAHGRQQQPDANEAAAIHLGYQAVKPVLVPATWSEFVAKGPRLDTNSARQPQGS